MRPHPTFFSPAARAPDEVARQAALDDLGVLDTPPEPRFDRIVEAAAARFGAPIAALSLVDRDRQWFKAKTGLDASETPRAYSFCAHVPGAADDMLIVPDATLDLRFSGNPLVTGPLGIRFYAGVALRAANGQPLGALCVIDRHPRADFSEGDRRALRAFASAATAALLGAG